MAYRYSLPLEVANASQPESKRFTVKFPGAILVALGMCRPDFTDVRVYNQAGQDLPCIVTAWDLTVGYPAMPVGRQVCQIRCGDTAVTTGPTAPATGSDAIHAVTPREVIDSQNPTQTNLLVWGEDLEDTCISQGSPSQFYGLGTAHKMGQGSAAGQEWKYLAKPWVGALLKGTVASAKFYAHLTPGASAPASTFDLHRMANVTVYYPPSQPTNGFFPWAVASGWSVNTLGGYPTWNTRMYDYQPTDYGNTVGWLNGQAGCGAASITSEHATLAVPGGWAAGYRSWDLPVGWIEAWANTDEWAQGFIVKDMAAANGTDRTATIAGHLDTTAKPFLHLVYSALDEDQFTKRKVSTDTYCYATYSTQERYAATVSQDAFCVMVHVNAEMRYDVAYITPRGRMSRPQRNLSKASERFDQTGQAGGLYYDPTTHQYSVIGNSHTGHTMRIGVSPADHAGGVWTWYSAPFGFYKGNMVVLNGRFMVFAATSADPSSLYYSEFTPPGTWAGPYRVTRGNIVGVMRGTTGTILGTTAMDGAGEIQANGSVADYPDWGLFQIDAEWFTYAGLDRAANRFTGVVRAVFGTSAVNHAAGTTIRLDHQTSNYGMVKYDATKQCLHVSWCNNGSYNGFYAYLTAYYARHYLAEPATVWRDQADQILTLPMDASAANRSPLASGPGDIAYPEDLTVLRDGTVLILYGCHVTDGAVDGASGQTNLKRARLAPGSTQWDWADLGDMQEASQAEGTTDGYLTVTGLNDPYGTKQTYLMTSEDGGLTYGDRIPMNTYTIPTGPIWLSSNTDETNLDGLGLMYLMHDAHHGALYLEPFGTPNPSTPLASFGTLRRLVDNVAEFPAVRTLVNTFAVFIAKRVLVMGGASFMAKRVLTDARALVPTMRNLTNIQGEQYNVPVGLEDHVTYCDVIEEPTLTGVIHDGTGYGVIDDDSTEGE